MTEQILTVSGRPLQVPAGCRLPLRDYRALASLARERHMTLSGLLRQAAQTMLIQSRMEEKQCTTPTT